MQVADPRAERKGQRYPNPLREKAAECPPADRSRLSAAVGIKNAVACIAAQKQHLAVDHVLGTQISIPHIEIQRRVVRSNGMLTLEIGCDGRKFRAGQLFELQQAGIHRSPFVFLLVFLISSLL